MAGTIGTNVTADGSAEYEMINKILQAIENRQLLAARTEEARMARIVGNHIAKGGEGSYKLVDRKYECALRKALSRAKVPYTVIYDNQGNAAFVTRNIDSEKFERAQKDVFSQSVEFFAQQNLGDLCEVSKRSGDKSVITLSFKSEADFNEAQIKLYNSGTVCAIDKDNFTIYVNNTDVYLQDGNDLTSFEIEWAMNQSLNDEMFGGNPKSNTDSEHQEYRAAQANHDMQQIKTLSKAAKSGEHKVLVDATNGSNTYLEAENGELHIYKEKNGEWEKVKTFKKLPLQSEETIGNIVSKYGFDIRNAIAIDGADKEKIINATSEKAKEWSKAWSEKVEKDEKGKEYRPNKLRPVIAFSGKNAEIQKLKKTALKEALSAVEHEARERVSARKEFYRMTPQERRTALKEEIGEILKEGSLPAITKFLNTGTLLTVAEKREWLNNIGAHLTQEKENIAHECKIEKVDIKELERGLRDKEKQEREKQEREKQAQERKNGNGKDEKDEKARPESEV